MGAYKVGDIVRVISRDKMARLKFHIEYENDLTEQEKEVRMLYIAPGMLNDCGRVFKIKEVKDHSIKLEGNCWMWHPLLFERKTRQRVKEVLW